MRYIRIAAFLTFMACAILSCDNSSPMAAFPTEIPSSPTRAATASPTSLHPISIPATNIIAAATKTLIPNAISTPSPMPELSEDEWLSRQNPVVEMAWSQDGDMLTVNAISGFYVFDLGSNEIVYSLEQSEFLFPFASEPQGRYLFAEDQVWDVLSGQLVYQLPMTDLSTAVFSSDSKTLAVSNNTGITLWDAVTGKLREALSVGFGDGQQGLAFSPDGNLLYAVSDDHSVKRIDLVSGQYVQLFSLPEDSCCVTFSPDSTLMLVRRPKHGEGSNQLWSVEQGELIKDSGRCDNDVGLATFSPDSQYFVIGPCVYDAQLWDVATPQLLHSFSSNVLSNYDSEWRSAAFSPDGTKIALGNEVGEVLIWDIDSYRLVNTLSIPLSSSAE